MGRGRGRLQERRKPAGRQPVERGGGREDDGEEEWDGGRAADEEEGREDDDEEDAEEGRAKASKVAPSVHKGGRGGGGGSEEWVPPWEVDTVDTSADESDGLDASEEEKYMEGVWEDDSDPSWEPPGERTIRERRRRPEPRRRGSRSAGAARRALALEEGVEDEDALDAEEEVDREDPNQVYCPLDLDSFNGRAVPKPGPEDKPLPATYDDPFRDAWGDLAGAPRPGQPGFNAFAAGRMRDARVGMRTPGLSEGTSRGAAASSAIVLYDGGGSCPPLQPHQEMVSFLLHPTSPISRILVDHPTGSGKTREMIRVLDGLFDDPRPKVPIFPKLPVCRNFYVELLRWPSRYRDYYCCVCPGGAYLASGVPSWRSRRRSFWSLAGIPESKVRDLARSVREVLEMRGAFFEGEMRLGCRQAFRSRHPGEPFPAAPLRALGYASAGGHHVKLDGRGRPLSSFLKVGHRPRSSNVYDHKVVLMDEAHNLVRTETRYVTQLTALRDRLVSAAGSVLVAFTGTPILSDPGDGRVLLDVIKGEGARGANDEGFISCLAHKPRALFPVCTPEGVPEVKLTAKVLKQLCHRVPLHDESLQSYLFRTQVPGLPQRRLLAYCNMCAFIGSYHDGRNGCKEYVLSKAAGCAPKFHAIAAEVVRARKKALVLVSRGTGFRCMLDVMKEAAAKAKPPFQVASTEQLADFNLADNIRGERFLCMVADSAQCGEGVSFLAVRALHLADVPPSPSALSQQCGRASRMFGHHGLRPEEQNVTVHLWVAELPAFARDPLGSWALLAFQRRGLRGAEGLQRAQRLLSRLRAAGVKSLEELRKRADAAAGAERAGSRKGPADRQEGLAALLRKLKLPEEAAAPNGGPGSRRAARPGGGSRASGLDGAADGHRPPLLRALRALCGAPCEEVVAGLPTETADEVALRQLSELSGKFVEALAGLRAVAVDRAVLGDHPAEEEAGERADVVPAEVEPLPRGARAAAALRKRPSALDAAALQIQASAEGDLVAAEPAQKRLRLGTKGPAEAPVAQAARLRLRGKTSASEPPTAPTACTKLVVARAPAPGRAALPAGSGDSNAAAELRSWSVAALRAELLRLRPGEDLRGAVEKADLCRLVSEARAAGAAPPGAGGRRHLALGQQATAASRRGTAALSWLACVTCRKWRRVPSKSAEDLGELGFHCLAAGRSCADADELRLAETQLDELRGWSLAALRDVLAAVRPDVDARSIERREELCRLLEPWLTSGSA